MEVSEDDDDDGNTRIVRKLQAALRNEARELDYQPWFRHTFQSIDDLQWESSTKIRSITSCATVFFPYALPHAMELEHPYHCRPRYSWCEFYCYWHFRPLVRFDGEPNGDDVQKKTIAGSYIS